MSVYYFESGKGCGLREFRSLAEAEDGILAEVGTYDGVEIVRLATEEDVSWIAAMGGRVPRSVTRELAK